MQRHSQPVRPAAVLAVLSLAAFVASLDLFIVNVAFDDIGAGFGGIALTDLSWVLNGYAIVYAALLLPLGRLADRYGRKAGFLLGLGLFTAASLACAAATELWVLVAFRVLQAVGAAALTPTSLGLLLPVFAPERRAFAVRVWAASGALAAAIGPAVGGLLVELSWRWVFLVNVPVGVLAMVVAVRLVPDSRDPTVGRIPDLVGAAASAVAVGALALALTKAPTWGWASGSVLMAAAVAGLGLVVVVVRCTRHPSPLVEPALVRVRAFAWANVATVAFSVAFAANLLATVLWLQQVWGYSAVRTGLAVALGPAMVPLFAAVAGALLARGVRVGRVAAAGCVLFSVGMVLTLARLSDTPDYATRILPGLLVSGVGVGLAFPTLFGAATADLPAARMATGSALVTMSRQVGSVLGVSLLVAVLGRPGSYAASERTFSTAWWLCAVASLLGAAAALGMTPGRPSRTSSPPAASGSRPVAQLPVVETR